MTELTLELLKSTLDKYYPVVKVTSMDNSYIWLSLDTPIHGSIVEYQGKKYKVCYSWKWMQYGNASIGYIPIYAAEVHPVENVNG